MQKMKIQLFLYSQSEVDSTFFIQSHTEIN